MKYGQPQTIFNSHFTAGEIARIFSLAITRLFIVLIAYGAISFAQAVPAIAAPQRNILILYSYHDELPWQHSIREGLRTRLSQIPNKPAMTLYEERLDMQRFSLTKTERAWTELLRQKYQGIKFDVIVAEDESAVRLLNKNPDLFDYKRRISVNADAAIKEVKHGETVVVTDYVEESMRMALELVPKARRLVVISNFKPMKAAQARAAWEANFKNRVSFEAWENDFTFEELNQRAANLPKDAVILYALVDKDRTGARSTPREGLKRLVAHASVPIFVTHDTVLGSGSVGGRVLSGEKLGWAVADMITGAPSKNYPPEYFLENRFDARALARWGIPDTRLPPDSRVSFREKSLWEEHRTTISVIVVLIIAETIILVMLVQAFRSKRAALVEVSKAHAEMEKRIDERTAELKEANERLVIMSVSDGLTQLANRRHFDEVLNREFFRLYRSGAPLSLIMLDLDFFKDFNDALGHVEGDKCLVSVATILSAAATRASDLAARYGGEEFMVILPETDAKGALVVAERLRTSIAALAISHPASAVADHVTASVGVVTATATMFESPMELIKLADEQLYLAKSRGRNRVVARNLFIKKKRKYPLKKMESDSPRGKWQVKARQRAPQHQASGFRT